MKISNDTLPIDAFSSTTNTGQDNHLSNVSDYLVSLLEDLDGVEEHPAYHPEGDCLFHSLQVFQRALSDTNNPVLWAAALLHDVGKAVDYANHASVGSDMLSDILNPKITWLIRHNLDLLKSPKKTRRKWQGSQQLQDLEHLRRWDLSGRDIDTNVMSIPEAINILQPHFPKITQTNDTYLTI